LCLLFGNRRANLVAGAHRHRALVDDDLVVRHHAADIARRGQHVLQVGRAIFLGQRADGDELQRAMGHRAPDVGGELQATARYVALQDLSRQSRNQTSNTMAGEPKAR